MRVRHDDRWRSPERNPGRRGGLVEGAPPLPVPRPARARLAAALLILGAFAVVFAGVESPLFDLERWLVPKALALHVTALALLLAGYPSLRRIRWGRAELLSVAFVAWSAASTLLAANRWLALAAWGVAFSSLVVFLAAREFDPGFRWTVLGGVLAAVVAGAGLGVAQAYGLEWVFLAQSRAPGGTFGNRNFLAHVAAIAAPGVLVAGLRARRGWGPVAAVLGLTVLAAAIVLTRSRAAWLGGLGGMSAAVIG